MHFLFLKYFISHFFFGTGGVGNVVIQFLQKGILLNRSVLTISFSSMVSLSKASVSKVTLLPNCLVTNPGICSTYSISFWSSVSLNTSLNMYTVRIQLNNTQEFSNFTLNVSISGVQNPLVGGWWDFVPTGGVAVLSPGNVSIFSSVLPANASIDPRSTNFSSFNIQDARGLPATGSIVNLTIRIYPTRSVNSSGAIQVIIPTALQVVTGSTINVFNVSGISGTFSNLVVKPLNATSLPYSIFSIQYADSFNKASVPLLVNASINITIVIGPFITPIAQPTYTLSPFRARTVSQANDSSYSMSWDSPNSWGTSLTISRVVEESSVCCSQVLLSSMGPLGQISSFNITYPLAGALSPFVLSFVTPIVLSPTTTILIVLPAGFLTCTEADPTSSSRTDCTVPKYCVDQNLALASVGTSGTDGVITALSGWTIAVCANSATLGLCNVPPVSTTDCPVTQGTSSANSISITVMTTVSAGLNVQLSFSGITLPPVTGLTGPFSISLRPQTVLTPWTQATVNLTNKISAIDLPSANAFIGQQDTTISTPTTYNIFFLSETGLPANGWFEITFPSGIRIGTVSLIDSAFTGNFSGTSTTTTIYLEPPAVTQTSLYNSRTINLLPSSCVLYVARGIVYPSVPQYIPGVINWPASATSWATWYASGGCYKVSGAQTAKIKTYSILTSPSYVRQALLDSSVDTTVLKWFSISNVPINSTASNLGNNVARIGSKNCNVTKACFQVAFPPRGIINLTISGIINGPHAKFPTGTFQIRTYTPDGNLLERISSVAGSTFTSKFLNADIVLDSYGAHDLVGCLVVLRIDSAINVGSTIEVKFADPTLTTDVRVGFSGANTLSIDSSTAFNNVSFLAKRSSFFASTVQSGSVYVPVNASVLVQTPNNCFWNSNLSTLAYCSRITSIKAKILLATAVPAGSVIALHLSGQLRNPARPGNYSWLPDAVIVYQWDPSVPNQAKVLTEDSGQTYNPAQPTLVSNGLATPNASITSGLIVSPSMSIFVPYVNQSTNIKFSFITGSSVNSTDSIMVIVPPIFSFISTPGGSAPFISIVGPVGGLPGTLAVKNITGLAKGQSQITLARSSDAGGDCSSLLETSGLDQGISFTLGPFTCRSYAAINFNGQVEAGNLFGLFVVDSSNNIIEGSAQNWSTFPINWNQYIGSYPGPTVLPSILQVYAEPSNTKSASVSNITFIFRPASLIQNDTEFFVFLPASYSVIGDSSFSLSSNSSGSTSNTWVPLLSGISRKEGVVRNGMFWSVCLRIRSNGNIAANTQLVLQMSNILNPLGGTVQPATFFSVATAKGCLNISAMNCYWLMDLGNVSSAPTQPGEIQNAKIQMTSISAGNEVMLQLQFLTSNPFPVNGKVVVALPVGYYALQPLQYCSALLNADNTCPLPCLSHTPPFCPMGLSLNSSSVTSSSDGGIITFWSTNQNVRFSYSNVQTYPNWTFPLSPMIYTDPLHTPGYGGIFIALNVSAIRLRPVSGPAGFFLIQVLDAFGNLIDETDSPGVPSSSGDLIPNRLLMSVVQSFSMAAGVLTGSIVRFTCSNPIPSYGTITVIFPFGFDVSRASLSNITQNDGIILNISKGQTVTLTVLTGVSRQSVVQLFLSSVVNQVVVGLSGRFQIFTADHGQNLIDQDLNVLYQNIIPGLISYTAVSLQNMVAGSNTDVLVSLMPSFNVTGSLSLVLPPSFEVNASETTPVKDVSINTKQLCTSISKPCSPSNTTILPLPVPVVSAVFPGSLLSGVSQTVTIFGTNFDPSPRIYVRFGSQLFSSTIISSSQLQVGINCDLSGSGRPNLCNFSDHAGVVDYWGCNMSVTNGVIQPSRCSPKLCGGTGTQSFCQNMITKLTVQVDVSLDGIVFTSSNVKFSIYRPLTAACPNNCGSLSRGTCLGSQCTCLFPYDGIDCGIAPTPLSVAPNFGPMSGPNYFV